MATGTCAWHQWKSRGPCPGEPQNITKHRTAKWHSVISGHGEPGPPRPAGPIGGCAPCASSSTWSFGDLSISASWCDSMCLWVAHDAFHHGCCMACDCIVKVWKLEDVGRIESIWNSVLTCGKHATATKCIPPLIHDTSIVSFLQVKQSDRFKPFCTFQPFSMLE